MVSQPLPDLWERVPTFSFPPGRLPDPSRTSWRASLPLLACHKGLQNPTRPMGGPPDPYRLSGKACRTLPGLWKGLPTPSGPLRGPPDPPGHSRGPSNPFKPSGRASQPLPDLRDGHLLLPARTFGRAYRPLPGSSEGHPTSPGPKGWPPDPSRKSGKASQPLLYLKREPTNPSRTSERTS